jgi:hypothetical protein
MVSDALANPGSSVSIRSTLKRVSLPMPRWSGWRRSPGSMTGPKGASGSHHVAPGDRAQCFPAGWDTSGMRAEVALGRFRERFGGRDVTEPDGNHHHPPELVKLLALAPAHRLPADRVLNGLWRQLSPDAAAANLRKAAHLVRRTLGDPGTVVLRGGTVALWPGANLQTDVEVFEAEANAASRRRTRKRSGGSSTGAIFSQTTATRSGQRSRESRTVSRAGESRRRGGTRRLPPAPRLYPSRSPQ